MSLGIFVAPTVSGMLVVSTAKPSENRANGQKNIHHAA
jgi:hypothetical protein